MKCEMNFMLQKLALYAYTVKSMKASQIYYRLRKMAKLDCSIGCSVQKEYSVVNPVATISELDYDPAFLARFSAEELMQDKVTFLHSSKNFSWNTRWEFEDKSALWNFNLHYFEFLSPLVKTYRETGNSCFLEKTVSIIRNWIEQNPKGQRGPGWSPYTIDLRLTNWLSYYSEVGNELDAEFKRTMIDSIHEQYEYLSRHLEKDILGNHYFENLKTLVLCSLFFNDGKMLKKALIAFKAECKEEILPDGMHFELSPMYHKLVFEGVLRVACALRAAGQEDAEIEGYLQPMLDVAWSFEEGLERIPLFNDGGNNVAKSLDALVKASEKHFGLKPEFQAQLKASGFYIFKKGDWKLIVDAGQPGPKYIPGHAHCDAMSFELFKNGKAVIVNCGTYAYQCKERGFFRSTAAHNTVMVNGVEQSQCWDAFRMAKRSSVKVTGVDENTIAMLMTDQKGQKVSRNIVLTADALEIADTCNGHVLNCYLHAVNDVKITAAGEIEKLVQQYAVDYGKKIDVDAMSIKNRDGINTVISFE